MQQLYHRFLTLPVSIRRFRRSRRSHQFNPQRLFLKPLQLPKQRKPRRDYWEVLGMPDQAETASTNQGSTIPTAGTPSVGRFLAPSLLLEPQRYLPLTIPALSLGYGATETSKSDIKTTAVDNIAFRGAPSEASAKRPRSQ